MLWLADTVDEQLDRYRAEQGIGATWEAQIPAPPEPGDSVSVDEIGAALILWRHEVDLAVDRCCRVLAVLLAAAGHEVPEPGSRGLDRYSPDSVIRVWLTLVDTDAPEAQDREGLLGMFRPPLLVLGLTGLADQMG